ncbi:MAG: peptide deformylase [Lentisphaerae bacterium]|nr:peptide deformylase [Lentisphaerota bacterium]
MVQPIVTFGDDALRAKARPVTEITPEIRQLVADMLESMQAARGVGLAAEQIGRQESVCVIDVPTDAEKEAYAAFNASIAMPLVMLNPEITAMQGKQRDEEGCLSFPEISVHLTRAVEVTVAYTDLEGTRRTLTARGLLARAIQHETDHLNGVLLVDRMSTLQRASMAGKLRRLRAQAGASD